MGKKKLIAIGIVVVLGIALGSFTSASAKKVTLVWWTEYHAARIYDAIRETIEKPFEIANPDVDLKVEYFPDYDRILRTALVAEAGPDIIDLHGPSYAIEYVDANMLLLLDEYAEKFGWKEKIFPWAIACSMYKGHLTSLPVHYETMLLWYNRTMFEEKGWNLATDWDSFVSLCEKQDAAGVIPLTYGSVDFVIANSWMTSIFFSCIAGPENVKRVLTGEMKWTEEPFKKAIEKYRFLWQKGWISEKQSAALALDDSWGLWQDKRAAMKFEGTWALQNVFDFSKGFDWDWAPIPQLEPGVVPPVIMGIGSNIALNAKTEHPDQAATFLDFLFSDPKRAGRIMDAARGEFWVPIKLSKADFPPEFDERMIRCFEYMGEGMASGNIGYCTWTFWPPKTDAFQYQNLDSVVLDRMSIEDYLASSQEIFEQELAEGRVPTLP